MTRRFLQKWWTTLLLDPDLKTFQEVVLPTPGPSPWYLQNRESNVTWHGHPLHWSKLSEHGQSHLHTGETSLLVVGFQCHIHPMPGNTLLILNELKEQELLRMAWIDIETLEPIADVEYAQGETDTPKDPLYLKDGLQTLMTLPLNLSPGEHAIPVEPPFASRGEILQLVKSTYLETHQTDPSHDTWALYQIQPAKGRVTVYPQDWFNHGKYDYGWQWPTRVARDPKSNRIFGEGIRLGGFILDDTYTQVAKHLPEDKIRWLLQQG